MGDLVDTPGKDRIHAELSTDDTTSMTLSQNEKKRDISGGVTLNIPIDLVLLLGDEKKKRDLATDLGVNTDLAVTIALALGYDVNADGSISNQKKRNAVGNLLETVDNSVHGLGDTLVGVENEWEADENENGGSGSDSEVDDETADESKRALDTQANVEHSNNALDALVVAGTGPATLVIRPSIEEEKRDVGNINVDNLSGNLNAAQDGVAAPANTKVMTKREKRAPLGDITISNLAGNINAAQDGVSAPADTEVLSENTKRSDGIPRQSFNEVNDRVSDGHRQTEEFFGPSTDINFSGDIASASFDAKDSFKEKQRDANAQRNGNFFDDAAGVFNHAIDDVGVDVIANLKKKEKRLPGDPMDGSGSEGGGRHIVELLAAGLIAKTLSEPTQLSDDKEEIGLSIHVPVDKSGQSDAQSNSDVSTKNEKRLLGGILGGEGGGLLGGLLGKGGSGGNLQGLSSGRGAVKVDAKEDIDVNLDSPQAKSDAHLDSDASSKKEKRFLGQLLGSVLGGGGSVSDSDSATASTEGKHDLHLDLSKEKRQNVNANVGTGGLNLDAGVDALLGGLGNRLAANLDANSRLRKREERRARAEVVADIVAEQYSKDIEAQAIDQVLDNCRKNRGVVGVGGAALETPGIGCSLLNDHKAKK